MAHNIDENITNSDIIFCINEYVRIEEHRLILFEKWFKGLSFEELADKHRLSANAVKKIVWDIGDKILLKAQKLNKK